MVDASPRIMFPITGTRGTIAARTEAPGPTTTGRRRCPRPRVTPSWWHPPAPLRHGSRLCLLPPRVLRHHSAHRPSPRTRRARASQTRWSWRWPGHRVHRHLAAVDRPSSDHLDRGRRPCREHPLVHLHTAADTSGFDAGHATCPQRRSRHQRNSTRCVALEKKGLAARSPAVRCS